MSEIDYNNPAYNAVIHENRFYIEAGIEEELEDNLDPRVGIFLTKNNESMPVFAPVGSCERVFSRKEESGLNSGARIVLTRDNYGHRATGLGGIGASKCEAIDIVAGSLSSSKAIRTGETQSRANFAEDGARIYLTERGDINAYFATAKSETAGVSASSKLKSGIGIKADHTLLIGRERVRILAGTSKYDGGERLVTGNQPTKSVIEIGSTTSEKHHKAVLGDNLVKHLRKINKSLSKLNEKILSLEIDLVNHKFAMAVHQHQGFGLGAVVTFPDPISAIPGFLDSVPKVMNNISEAITDEYNQVINESIAFGLPDIAVEGSKKDKILSSTVYIGE